MRLNRHVRKAAKRYHKAVEEGNAHADFVASWVEEVAERVQALNEPEEVRQMFRALLLGTAEFQSDVAEAINTDLRGESEAIAKPFKRLAERTTKDAYWAAGQEVVLWGQVLLVIGRNFTHDFQSYLDLAKLAIPFRPVDLDLMVEVARRIPEAAESDQYEVVDLESLVFAAYLNQMRVKSEMPETERDYITSIFVTAWDRCRTEFLITYEASMASRNN